MKPLLGHSGGNEWRNAHRAAVDHVYNISPSEALQPDWNANISMEIREYGLLDQDLLSFFYINC